MTTTVIITQVITMQVIIMKFYNRENELKLLAEADRSKQNHSVMTMILGRRRVGKTALSLQNYTNDPKLYFFISRKSETLLCEEFIEEIETKLDRKVIGSITTFEDIFSFVIEIAKSKKITLIIDEFQEFYKINASIYSSIQKIWDLNKASTHLHFIACGSIYSLMKKIYEDQKEPLFGRADYKINLKPLNVSVIKQVLSDYDHYSSKNLLDFYILTGGIAKYIELFVLYQSFDLETMIERIVSQNSLFLDEGRNRLIEEFGKEYATYFSVLSLIASSKTSKPAIESIIGKNISGHLFRLEHDYNIIKSIKPINSKPNAKLQKYQIEDNFLNFWFRFIYKYQSIIEAENYTRLKTIIFRDFDTFRGKFLEKLFIDLLKEKQKYTKIGSWWQKGNKNEIDIVAIDDIDKELLICEVKLSKSRLNKNKLILKSSALIEQFSGYTVKYQLLSIDDIEIFLPVK